MGRWRANLPRYRTPIIIQRSKDGPSSRIGNQNRRGGSPSNLARVLKAFDTTTKSNIDLPSVSAPANHAVPPGTYATGWTAWWPTPPSPVQQPYYIPDPPEIDRTALPTRANPILWEAFATINTASWDARISAVYVLCEWMPKTGREQLSGMAEISTQEAALKIRPGIIATAGITAKEWDIIAVDTGEAWQLEATTPSFRRGEFVELMVKRNGA